MVCLMRVTEKSKSRKLGKFALYSSTRVYVHPDIPGYTLHTWLLLEANNQLLKIIFVSN